MVASSSPTWGARSSSTAASACRFRLRRDGKRFVMHRMPSGVTIFFDEAFFPGADPERGTVWRAACTTSPSSSDLGTREAADATTAALRRLGYTVRTPPWKSSGPYASIVEDPDGNALLTDGRGCVGGVGRLSSVRPGGQPRFQRARRRRRLRPMTTTPVLQRPRSGRVIAGVCAGLANALRLERERRPTPVHPVAAAARAAAHRLPGDVDRDPAGARRRAWRPRHPPPQPPSPARARPERYLRGPRDRTPARFWFSVARRGRRDRATPSAAAPSRRCGPLPCAAPGRRAPASAGCSATRFGTLMRVQMSQRSRPRLRLGQRGVAVEVGVGVTEGAALQ